ncbi:MAG: PH domain-containing protein [Patescibacteria group bacterium]
MKGYSYIEKPTNICFDGEDSDEQIILLLRKHLITNLGWVFLLFIILLIPVLLSVLFAMTKIDPYVYISPRVGFSITAFWYLFTFGFILTNILGWYYNVYIVTNKKIIDVDFHGILYRNVSEAPIRNIEDITNRISGAAQVIFHYGDVIIQTAGETREFDFIAVPDPSRVQDVISDLVSNLRISPEND